MKTHDGLFLCGLLIAVLGMFPISVLIQVIGNTLLLSGDMQVFIALPFMFLVILVGFAIMGKANQMTNRDFVNDMVKEAIKKGRAPEGARALALYAINSTTDFKLR